MSSQVAAFVALIPIVAFVGFLAVSLLGRALSAKTVFLPALIPCGYAGTVSAVALIHLVRSGRPAVSYSTEFVWLSIPGSRSPHVNLGATCDLLSAMPMLIISIGMALVIVHVCNSDKDAAEGRRFTMWTSLLFFANVTLLVATNLIVFLFAWQLTALAGSLLLGAGPDNDSSGLGARKLFLVNRLVDVLLVAGIGGMWLAAGSLDVANLFGVSGTPPHWLAGYLGPADDPHVFEQRVAVLDVIGLCLLGASVGRCAQFPLFGWLNNAARCDAGSNAVVQALAVMPTGIYLLMRCQPLFDAAFEVYRIMPMIGGLTVLFCSIIALCSTGLKHALGFLSAGLFGWMLIGLGLEQPQAQSAALLLLVAHMFAVASLWLIAQPLDALCGVSPSDGGIVRCGESRGLRWVFFIGAVVVVSGLWGQNAILSALWRNITAPGPTGNIFTARALLAIGLLGLFLNGLALFRIFFLLLRTENELTTRSEATPTTPFRPSTRIPAIISCGAIAVGIVPIGMARWFGDLPGLLLPLAGVERLRGAFQFDFGSLSALAGIISAWILFRRPLSLPAWVVAGLTSVKRIGQNRFYVDDAGFLLIVLPTRGLAQLCRFFDWLVIDGVITGLPGRMPAIINNNARALRIGVVQFYGLSLLLASAVLIAVFTWLKG